MKIIAPSALLSLALAASAIPTYAAERKIPCDKVPSVVQERARARITGATLHGCVEDKTNGKTTYELEFLKNGKSSDMTFDPQGNLLEIEEQVELSALPEPVQTAFRKAANGGQIGKVESLTSAGVLKSYETTIKRNGKSKEIAVRPDGTSIPAN